MDNWDHFQEELDHQHSNEYQFWLLNHHSKPCCYFDGDKAFLKYRITTGNVKKNRIWLIPCWILSATLLVIVIVGCSSIPEAIWFKIEVLKVHTLIENQLEECCGLGKIVSQTFTFFNKMPQKIQLFLDIIIPENAPNIYKKRFLSSHWQMAFPQGSVVLSQTTRLVKVSKEISYIVLDAAQFPSATSLKSITVHLNYLWISYKK